MPQGDGTSSIERRYWRQLAWAGGVILAVGTALSIVAVVDGATTKDITLAFGTSLLTGAIVTLAIALIDRSRENAEAKWQDILAKRLIAAVSPSLRGTDLAGAKLLGQDLSGKNFAGADLSGSDLRSATLSGAILANADLRKADLRGCWLIETDCKAAHLEGADLRGAWLRGTDFTGAYLDEFTDFSGADLRSSVGGRKTTFKDATFVKTDGTRRTSEVHMKAVGAKFDDIEWPRGIERPEGANQESS